MQAVNERRRNHKMGNIALSLVSRLFWIANAITYGLERVVKIMHQRIEIVVETYKFLNVFIRE